jgi:hypothetical protein
MKKIAFRYYSFFVSTVLRTRYFITERHYYKIVTRFSKSKKTKSGTFAEIKNNTLFFKKKNEVVRLSSINGNFATNNAREIFSRIPGVSIARKRTPSPI